MACHLQIWHCTAVYWYIPSWFIASKRTVVISWFREEWRGSNIIFIYYFEFISSFPHLFSEVVRSAYRFCIKHICQWRSFLSYRTWIFLESTSTTILVSLITWCLLLMDLLHTLVFQSAEWHSLVSDTEMSLVVSLETLWAQILT